MVGPGLDAALSRLGEAGQALRRQWSAMSEKDLLVEEGVIACLRLPEAAMYDERLRATRWRAYRRVGLVCAVLRMAGRRSRPGEDNCLAAG